jgi:hypothetical protein
MRSALYYPHTQVKSEELLKTALLLWDNLYVIAPWPEYRPQYDLHQANEAFSIIGRCHYPSDDEKRRAHGVVEDFVARPLPAAFSYTPGGQDSETYDIFPQKLLPDTVEMLRERRMSAEMGPRNMRASVATGLTLMNIIADCCAGSNLARITDQGTAYANLAGLLIEKPAAGVELDQARERLLPIPIRVVNVDGFSIEALIDLRRREEAAADGSQIRNLRHRFVDKMEEQAKRLTTADSALAREAIEREFEADMHDDYRDLNEALKTKALQIIGTKEFVTAVIAGASVIAAAVFARELPIVEVLSAVPGIVSVGGLISTKSKWVEDRKKILSEHPTAYLYKAVGGLQC